MTKEFAASEGPLHLSNVAYPTRPIDDPEDFHSQLDENDSSYLTLEELQEWLAEEYRLSALSPTAACPELALITSEKRIEADDENLPPLKEGGRRYAYDNLTVRLPNVDLTQGTATFNVARVCGPLCAGGASVTYVRTGTGEWVHQSESPTWIS